MKPEHVQKIQREKRIQVWALVIAIFAITGWSAVETGFSFTSLFFGSKDAFVFIFTDLLPPDFSVLVGLIDPALDTIYMSFVAMIIGTIIAAFLAVFFSGNDFTSSGPASFYAWL